METTTSNDDDDTYRRILSERLVEASPDGVLVIDEDERAVRWNGRTLEIWGFGDTVEPGVHRSVLMKNAFDGLVDPVGFSDRLKEIYANPDRAVHDLVQFKDGRFIERFSVGIVLPDGKRRGRVWYFRDVTAAHRAETALQMAKAAAEAASRAKSDFLANMSHELRTPLNAIMGFAETIKLRLLGDVSDIYAEYATHIHESGSYLLGVITEILDLSKIDSGKVVLADELIHPQDLVQSCLMLVMHRANLRDISIETDMALDLPPIRVDVLRMKQVLLNLLSNAIKFSEPGSVVTVTAMLSSDAGMQLTVEDRGRGMAETDIPIALEPFRQLENPFNRTFDGTGLGLPIAKSLTEHHGGRLRIRSAPGQGTAATVVLPPDRVVSAP